MKKFLLLVSLCAIVLVGYGQKKPKISAALKALQDGNLGEAKNIIDAAAEHEKTREDGKTWYYKGLIYAALDTTSNKTFNNLADNPLQTAMDAFAKADEKQKGSSEYYVSSATGLPDLKSQQIQRIWGTYLNKGVEAFQNDDTENAVKHFTKCQIVMPDDTTGYIYAGLAAQSLEDYEVAAKNYYYLIEKLDYANPDTYNALIYIEGTANKDGEKALELIRMAREKYPNDTEFAKSEITQLIRLEKIDEAKSELESAIQREPDNSNLYFTLGVMYEETGELDKAAESYTTSIEKDPEFYNSIYNLAVLYYNQAVEMITAKNNLGITAADMKKAETMQTEITNKLKKALPYWEKAHELDNTDRTALETLQYIYLQVKDYEKAEAVKAKLDSMGQQND